MSRPDPIRIEATSFSFQGGREYNEDFLGDCEADGLRLFVLADGAGGHGGGDVASRTAVEAAQAAFRELPAFTPDTLRRCIARAHQKVTSLQQSERRLARMASTMVVLLVSCEQSQALSGNLGDSRCYAFRGDRVTARSQDHSLVQRFIEAGLYPADRLRQHPRRNVLYASLGAYEEDVEPALSEETLALEPGDGLLLCSDGVWELLEDTELARLHAASETVHDWRDRLLATLRANMPEGHDNHSAYLLRCLSEFPSGDDTIMPAKGPVRA